MCLIALAWQADPRFELVLAANRDEAHARPSAPAGRADDDPSVVGGVDLVQGGGWLQASAAGRLAAVTNVRVGLQGDVAPRSRGTLVHALVRDPLPAWESLAAHAAGFGRFNLLAWDGTQLDYAGNHPHYHRNRVAPGLHALSNGDLDAPWPKANRARDAIGAWLASADAQRAAPTFAALFAALADTRQAPDAALPDTGVGLALERALSPPFVRGDAYGTRCSTVVLVAADAIVFHERRFGPDGAYAGQSRLQLPRTP